MRGRQLVSNKGIQVEVRERFLPALATDDLSLQGANLERGKSS